MYCEITFLVYIEFYSKVIKLQRNKVYSYYLRINISMYQNITTKQMKTLMKQQQYCHHYLLPSNLVFLMLQSLVKCDHWGCYSA